MTNPNLDFSRHMSLFDPYEFGDTPVHVIGAGATGSWLVLQLAKLGISNIHVYDYDVIEEHNIPNQLFGLNHIGKKKVVALTEIVSEQTGILITPYDEKVESKRFDGYVFVMVDSMESRKRIFNLSIRNKSAIKLMIEPRMGLNEGRVYAVEPIVPKHIERWLSCWYPDDEAEVSACGTSQSVITTALQTSAICVRQVINHFNGVEIDNELLIDMMYHTVYPTKW